MDDNNHCEVCGQSLDDHALAVMGGVAVAGSYRDDGTFHHCISPCLDAHLTTIVALTARVQRLRDGHRQILTGIWTARNSLDTIKWIARQALYTNQDGT